MQRITKEAMMKWCVQLVILLFSINLQFGPTKGDPQRTYVMTVVVLSPWRDSLAKADCDDWGFMSIVCKKVQTELGKETTFDTNITFLGTAPTLEDHVAMLFTASLTDSRRPEMTTVLKEMMQKIQSTPVSRDVDIRLLSDLGINVRPLFGPRTGGTLVTITGHGQLGTQVSLGPMQCLITAQTQILSICAVPRLTDNNLVNRGLNITTQDGSLVSSTGALFTYKMDPVITKVQPLRTILDGGVLLTVFGAQLDVPKVRDMITTVTSRETGKQITFKTPCRGALSDQMLCPTPPIVLGDLLLSQRHRRTMPTNSSLESTTNSQGKTQAASSINADMNIDIELGFLLDGVLDYRNLTERLPDYSKLDVFPNPVIQGFDPPSFSRTFTSTWPVGDRYLKIKGEQLLGGIEESGYKVMVGLAVCANTKVHTDLIICEPPNYRPQITPEDDVGFNRIPVKVLYGNRVTELGYLNYVQNIWEYPPGRYGIIGGICGLVLIIALIITCVCRKCRQLKDSEPGHGQYNFIQRINKVEQKKLKDIELVSSRRAEANYESPQASGRLHEKKYSYNVAQDPDYY